MTEELRIEYLADHAEALPTLAQWFEQEWAPYYGPDGPGDAEQDLLACCSRTELPVGLIALRGDDVCGTVALKRESILTHTHLSPWIAALLVAPPHRGQGIGTHLLAAMEGIARRLNYARLYCGTSEGSTLFARNGWRFKEPVRYLVGEGAIYEKAL